MIETRIAPGLLLAMPQLLDPNFYRTVVLMVDHGDSGSFGLVLNRPAPLRVTELLEGMSLKWAGDPLAQVGIGGPVQGDTGWMLHEPLASGIEVPPGTVTVVPGLQLSVSTETLQRLAADPPRRIRLFLGYAGWGPGQLVREVAEGAWLHAEATPGLVLATPAEEMWEQALRSIGIDPAAVVPTSGIN